jgi:hypothetical protein
MKTGISISNLFSNVHTGLYAAQHPNEDRPAAPPPFITISRQAGIGGRTFAHRLADRLNQLDPGDKPWTVWDRELVQAVAAEHHLPENVFDEIDATHRSAFKQWLDDVFNMQPQGQLDDFQLYRRLAITVRSLARGGRVILVGRGGIYATHDLPGGVHLRLIAPLAKRVQRVAALKGLTEKQATDEIAHREHERETFHRRFHHRREPLGEAFTATLDLGSIAQDSAVEALLPLILPNLHCVPRPKVEPKTATTTLSSETAPAHVSLAAQ